MQDFKSHVKQDAYGASPYRPSHEPPQNMRDIPMPLYRLRLSVLKDHKGNNDCPSQIFNFPSLQSLTTAIGKIDSTFGSGLSEYQINKYGVEAPETEGGRLEDGRTESVVICYDPQTADESWKEFLARLGGAEEGWSVEE